MGNWFAERKIVDTLEELSANAHAWHIIDAHAEYSRGERYGFYRAVFLTHRCQLRDDTPMVRASAPATYYASTVYFGHSYRLVVRGTTSLFNAGVSAEFTKWGASLDYLRQRQGITTEGSGRGLLPNTGSALFASPEEVGRKYHTDNRQPEAIVVVYRQIPDANVPVGPAAPQARSIEVRFTNLNVTSTGSSIKDYSNWSMHAQCYVNGAPSGQPFYILGGPGGGVPGQPEQTVRVSLGNVPVAGGTVVVASNADSAECKIDGNYTRGSWGFTQTHQFVPTSTGPIQPRMLPTSSSLRGGDAEASYALAWQARVLQ